MKDLANEKHSFGGVTFFGELNKEILNDFELLDRGSEEVIYVSKRMYHQDDENNSFDYRYVIDVCDMREYDKEAEYVTISIHFVPCLKDWAEKHINSLFSCSGLYVEDYNLEDDDSVIGLYGDVLGYGNDVCFARDQYDFDEEEAEKPFDEVEGVNELILSALQIIPHFNSLRGFYLDKQVNLFGNIGWDILESALDGSDWMQKGVERFRDMQAERERDK